MSNQSQALQSFALELEVPAPIEKVGAKFFKDSQFRFDIRRLFLYTRFSPMAHGAFIAKARMEDLEVSKTIAALRSNSRMMNLEFGRLRRRTGFSIQSGYAIPKTPQSATRPERPTRMSRLRPPSRQSRSPDPAPPIDEELFVIRTIHVKAMRPEPGQLSSPKRMQPPPP
jgi:hypothetical protein